MRTGASWQNADSVGVGVVFKIVVAVVCHSVDVIVDAVVFLIVVAVVFLIVVAVVFRTVVRRCYVGELSGRRMLESFPDVAVRGFPPSRSSDVGEVSRR